jgi:hypothetical protein
MKVCRILTTRLKQASIKRTVSTQVVKRLYIGDYDDRGKQRFISWGMTCTACGIIVKENYEPNLTPERMSRKEAGLRTRIGLLKQFYELMALHWGDLNIAWDDELVEQFLDVVPRPTIKELAEVFQPSWSNVNVDSQKWRRYRRFIDDPDKQGWLKSDRKKYKGLLESEALKRQEMTRDIIKSRAAQVRKRNE